MLTEKAVDVRSAQRELTIVQALREGVREEMRRDDDVFVLGEDIRIGGSFLFTLGLLDEFGAERVLNTPISEAGFVGLGDWRRHSGHAAGHRFPVRRFPIHCL